MGLQLHSAIQWCLIPFWPILGTFSLIVRVTELKNWATSCLEVGAVWCVVGETGVGEDSDE